MDNGDENHGIVGEKNLDANNLCCVNFMDIFFLVSVNNFFNTFNTMKWNFFVQIMTPNMSLHKRTIWIEVSLPL